MKSGFIVSTANKGGNMILDKNYKGLEFKNGRYFYDGNIETTENLEIKLDNLLEVAGYIKAGWSIKASWSIEASGYIEAGGSIIAGESIEAGEFIKAGESYGISAALYITAQDTISCGLKIFAGICTWKNTEDSDKTITCSKLLSGTVEYGILKETGEAKKKITIDGKEIEISLESFDALKRSLEEGR